MKKNFITGIIVGGLLFGTVGAFAGQYIATENEFPIELNGAGVYLQGYNIDNSTYFKLRDIADVVGGFDVDFQNNTILLSNNGYSYEKNKSSINTDGCIDVALKITAKKTQDNLSLWVDENNNEYIALTDVNSVVMDKGRAPFDIWVVSYLNGNWVIKYDDLTDDYMWENNLSYIYTGGQMYTSNGKYFILLSDYVNVVLPNLGFSNGMLKDGFVITNTKY